jgi:hypothetical protein
MRSRRKRMIRKPLFMFRPVISLKNSLTTTIEKLLKITKTPFHVYITNMYIAQKKANGVGIR